MLDATVSIASGGNARAVSLSSYLDADAEEAAARAANTWIKSLRAARVDGEPFRGRFAYRGESLWWFAELYLHKERAILALFRRLGAARALLDREAPDAIRLVTGDTTARLVLPQLARSRGIAYDGPPAPQDLRRRTWKMDARSLGLMLAAVGSPGRSARRGGPRPTVAAFVHRAFWRGTGTAGRAESYVGPVLQALEERLPPGAVRHIGIGPRTNFRARRWWRRAASGGEALQPIERLVPRTALGGSTGIWAARHAMRRALQRSADLRSAALIQGCDCWPVVSEALAGVALLQIPWSARAMDEAGAALDALQPDVALTYAEAGGWGRALALEARRRGVPLAGLQHGFIYRHWLNYLHEPDEMLPLEPGSRDRGFPLPTRTLVFDEHAARHLRENGRFPPESLVVTGSPRLDALAGRFRGLADAEIAAARAEAGASGTRPLVLLATKYAEAQRVLPALLEAVRGMPQVQLAVKTHPAETPEAYRRASAGLANVRVLSASAELAPLLRASRAVVTVNSTVALDAAALGVPALTIGLPNNLSPFVEEGALAGASGDHEIGPILERLLYDQAFRHQLSQRAAAVVTQYRMLPDGRAAARSAAAVLDLAGTAGRPHQE